MKSIFYAMILMIAIRFNSSAQNTFPPYGNVGIGIQYPGSALTVSGGGTGVSIQPGGNPYYGVLAFNREAATGAIFDPTGNAFQINNGGTDKNVHFQIWNGLGQLITNDAMVIAGNGFIGIGTANPKENLSVNGTIRTREIKVEASNWPDYVFAPTYQLIPLSKLERFIDFHHHLPGIQSAEEIVKDGVNLGEMNARLLKKIEELTLYLIQNQKELKSLKNKVNRLSKNAKLYKR